MILQHKSTDQTALKNTFKAGSMFGPGRPKIQQHRMFMYVEVHGDVSQSGYIYGIYDVCRAESQTKSELFSKD